MLFLFFKSVDGLKFDKAYSKLKSVIAQVFQEHLYLMDSDRVNVYVRGISQNRGEKGGAGRN
mgnify:FL=1